MSIKQKKINEKWIKEVSKHNQHQAFGQPVDDWMSDNIKQ